MAGLRIAVVACLLLAVLGSGCSGVDEGVDLRRVGSGNHRIAINPDYTFDPPHGRAPVGATIEWSNNGGLHDVTDADNDPPTWSSYDRDGNKTALKMGDLYTRQFLVPGIYHYRCTIHGDMGMTGAITIG